MAVSDRPSLYPTLAAVSMTAVWPPSERALRLPRVRSTFND